ncbi:uncharacterized protein LOC131051202 [Cryptomeria japonica]|uniref:uncharacterized protein LOC131051202 n=1 Tax=Cryptomeria japonica TaxID=3369 RepID=UPI0025AC9CC4|nr:uncharacterized protein LOC131051202 [Cryptomeria japonica]
MSLAARKSLNNLLKKFVWDGAKDNKRIPLINWDTLCLIKEDGVADLKKMELQNSTLGAKLSWKMCKEPQKLRCRLFQKKYLDSEDTNKILTMANTERGSATWNFLWDCRHIITNHISWQIGNGYTVLFWRDSWDGFLALTETFEDKGWVDMVENCIGKHVCNYMEDQGDQNGLRKWKKINIGNPSLCEQLWKAIKDRKIPESVEEDIIILCAVKSRMYSSKLGYEVQRQRGSINTWPHKLSWNHKVLPKVRAFLWITLHNRILTGDTIKNIGISGPNRCVMCCAKEESTNHLLFCCPVAEYCWNWFLERINWVIAKNERLIDFILAWPNRQKTKWCDLWLNGPSLIVWHIWKERNRRIFKEASLPQFMLVEKIKTSIEEVLNGKKIKGNPKVYTNWDALMEKRWALKEPQLYVPLIKHLDRKAIRWKAPPMDWTKLNFDSASKGNPGESNIEAIIRDEQGNILHGLFGGIGVATNNEPKICALEVGLCLCIRQGLSRIIIVGDSHIIINGISWSILHNWKLNKWVPMINEHLITIESYKIGHVYREGNQVVDYLANLGVGENDDPIYFSQASATEDIKGQCMKDYQRYPQQGIG